MVVPCSLHLPTCMPYQYRRRKQIHRLQPLFREAAGRNTTYTTLDSGTSYGQLPAVSITYMSRQYSAGDEESGMN